MPHKALRNLATVVLAGYLGACTTPPPAAPLSYDLIGSTTVVSDSVYPQGWDQATFCVVMEVDGLQIDNSIDASVQASRGKGRVLAVQRLDRGISPGVHRVTIGCRPTNSAPIADALNSFVVKGQVHFTAMQGHRYSVKGAIDKRPASVWIEDDSNSSRVTVEVVGVK